jgi:Na+/H+ antiporter NhaD/arsenite permease-like protein
MLTVIIIVMSNIASNVPTVLIMGPRLAVSTKQAGMT